MRLLTAARAFGVEIRFLAMQRHVEADRLVGARRTQRKHEPNELQQNEAERAAVGDRGARGGGLYGELTGISEQQPVGPCRVEALLREYSGQQRANRPADA